MEYIASSGHKLNHDMLRPNCRFVSLETPRFGRSMAVETIMKVNLRSGQYVMGNCDINPETCIPEIIPC